MAQAPQPPHKPAAPQQHQPAHQPAHKPGDKPADKKDDKDRDKPTDKDREQTAHGDKLHAEGEYKQGHVPLKDPNEGKVPAVAGGFVQQPADERFPIDPELGRRPTIGVKGEPIDDGERDPDTIAEEQRRRSEEMQRVGVERWMYDHDTRSEEEKGEFVGASDRLPVFAHPDAQFRKDEDKDKDEDKEPRRVEHHESRK